MNNINTDPKVVWVIGASSGLGLATAQAFYRAGYHVIAGARSFEEDRQDSHFTKLHLDVCDEASCTQFQEKALALAPHVDTFVYCAGILMFGPCELLRSEEYAHVIRTNFISLTRMVSQVLPTMRVQKQGKIILFSSINGLVATPFQSPYVASKHAIEGYAKCLGMELKEHGVQVAVVRPGDHKSGSLAYRKRCAADVEGSVYAAHCSKATNKVLQDEAHGSNPLHLGRLVVRLAEKRRMPGAKVIANPIEKLAVVLNRLLPNRLFHWILKKYYLG